MGTHKNTTTNPAHGRAKKQKMLLYLCMNGKHLIALVSEQIPFIACVNPTTLLLGLYRLFLLRFLWHGYGDVAIEPRSPSHSLSFIFLFYSDFVAVVFVFLPP